MHAGAGEARYQRGYAGAFDITPDWMPVLDQTSVRGLYVAAGMSGHGFKLSPAVGRMMADLIVRGHSDLADLRAFRLDRFGPCRTTTGAPSRIPTCADAPVRLAVWRTCSPPAVSWTAMRAPTLSVRARSGHG